MKTTVRIAALLTLIAVLSLWISTGAHRGWTQTSKVFVQRDEITDIDFPVRQKTFVAGVEILLAGAGLSAALFGTSFLVNRRTTSSVRT
jgi:hypothetical protein